MENSAKIANVKKSVTSYGKITRCSNIYHSDSTTGLEKRANSFHSFYLSSYVNTLGTAYGVTTCNTENAKEIFCYINVVCKVET